MTNTDFKQYFTAVIQNKCISPEMLWTKSGLDAKRVRKHLYLLKAHISLVKKNLNSPN